MESYGQKKVKLISQAGKNSGIFYKYISIQVCIVAAHNIREFKKNRTVEKMLANTRNANFWENGQKIG